MVAVVVGSLMETSRVEILAVAAATRAVCFLVPGRKRWYAGEIPRACGLCHSTLDALIDDFAELSAPSRLCLPQLKRFWASTFKPGVYACYVGASFVVSLKIAPSRLLYVLRPLWPCFRSHCDIFTSCCYAVKE